jgi:hypothetical protein
LRNFYSNIPTVKERLKAGDGTIESTKSYLADLKRESNIECDQRNSIDSDDEDYCDWGAGPASDSELDGVYKDIIKALQDCPMILGFHAVMTHANATACCYCPCSKKLQPWRAHHGIHDERYQCGSSPFTPSGIVAHLNQLQRNVSANNPLGMFHWIALRYIWQLYGNYWGPGVPHKGLCNMNDREYRAAEAKEKSHELAYVSYRWCF